MMKQQHGIRVRIRNNLVAQCFPGLDRLWSQAETENLGIVRWCLAPEKISRLKLEDFLRMVAPRYRGDRQYKRLLKIWQIASYSIAYCAGTALELDARRVTENGYFPQSQRQAQIIILEILQCIPVVIIFAFLDLEKNISFSDTLLGLWLRS